MCPRSFASTSSLPSSGRSARPPPRPSTRAPVCRSTAPSVSQPCRPAGHARGAPTLPTGMKVGGWHLQWVASGPAHNPALPHLSPRALCCSREGFLWDAVARALSSARSEPGSLRVSISMQTCTLCLYHGYWCKQPPCTLHHPEQAMWARHPTLPPPALPGWIRGSWRHLLKGLQIAKGKGEPPPALAGDGGAHPRCLVLSAVVCVTQGWQHCWELLGQAGG